MNNIILWDQSETLCAEKKYPDLVTILMLEMIND